MKTRSDFKEVVTDPRLEKRTRRRFSVAEKKRLLAEADALGMPERGGWWRRKGLYAGRWSNWRKELAEHGETSLAARKSARKPADSRDKEIERPAGKTCLCGRATGRSPKNVLHLFETDSSEPKS